MTRHRDVAIVSEVPGTTRDLVEVALDLRGMKVVVTDTAGLRESIDIIERIGIERALGAADRADLIVAVVDPLAPIGQGRGWVKPMLRVATKADLGKPAQDAQFDHVVSARTGLGLDELIEDIAVRAAVEAGPSSSVLPSRTRHVMLLQQCQAALETAVGRTAPELAAEELRVASDALGRITGTVDVEDLLDVIFSQFCIGK